MGTRDLEPGTRLAWSRPRDRGIRTELPSQDSPTRVTGSPSRMSDYSPNEFPRRRHPGDSRWDYPPTTRMRHLRHPR